MATTATAAARVRAAGPTAPSTWRGQAAAGARARAASVTASSPAPAWAARASSARNRVTWSVDTGLRSRGARGTGVPARRGRRCERAGPVGAGRADGSGGRRARGPASRERRHGHDAGWTSSAPGPQVWRGARGSGAGRRRAAAMATAAWCEVRRMADHRRGDRQLRCETEQDRGLGDDGGRRQAGVQVLGQLDRREQRHLGAGQRGPPHGRQLVAEPGEQVAGRGGEGERRADEEQREQVAVAAGGDGGASRARPRRCSPARARRRSRPGTRSRDHQRRARFTASRLGARRADAEPWPYRRSVATCDRSRSGRPTSGARGRPAGRGTSPVGPPRDRRRTPDAAPRR